MTKEELLELGIYVPEKVDSSIVVNLLMGNIVICCLKDNIVHKIYPVALTIAPLFYEKSHIKDRFCIFKNLESSKINCTDGPGFVSVWIDNMFSNYVVAPHEIKTILNHFDYD